MPIRIDEGKTPKGQRMMIARVSGTVTYEDAVAMGDLLKPGQPYHNVLVLNLVDKGTEYHPEARRHFQTFNGNFIKMAVVVTSPLVRAAINFMLRVINRKIPFQMFTGEAEALAWLDQ